MENLSFWNLSPDSNLNELDSSFPRQRYKIIQCLEDSETFGEWQDRGYSVLLYGKEQGIVAYVHDSALRILIEQFLDSSHNKRAWQDLTI